MNYFEMLGFAATLEAIKLTFEETFEQTTETFQAITYCLESHKEGFIAVHKEIDKLKDENKKIWQVLRSLDKTVCSLDDSRQFKAAMKKGKEK